MVVLSVFQQSENDYSKSVLRIYDREPVVAPVRCFQFSGVPGLWLLQHQSSKVKMIIQKSVLRIYDREPMVAPFDVFSSHAFQCWWLL
jgi:hypothetical protein